MADPGFPTGGPGPVGGGGLVLRRRCFLVKMYTKTKELGPIGGVHLAHPPDPTMYSVAISLQIWNFKL